MKTHSTSQLRGFAKSALLVSAAFPLSTLIAVSPAHADESVTVNSAETANDVNAKIGAAQAAPDRNIAITISTKGEVVRSEEHTSELPVTNAHLVCRLLLEKKKQKKQR